MRAQLAEFVGTDVLVAHNASFDRAFLPELAGNVWIDTLRLARHLYPDAPNYKNSTLRFLLDVNYDSLRHTAPHRALGDALVTGAVFAEQLRECGRRGIPTLDEVFAFVESPLLVTRFRYGKKYRNARIAEVPRAYLAWVLDDAAQPEPRISVDADTLVAIRSALLEYAIEDALDEHARAVRTRRECKLAVYGVAACSAFRAWDTAKPCDCGPQLARAGA